MSTTPETGVSFDPDTHSAGGYLDDVNCVIQSSEVVEFDYQGKREACCAWAVTFRPDDAESDDDLRTEYYRIGDLDKFTPSADRKQAVPVKTGATINRNTKASLFARSLKERGVSIGNDVSVIAGLHVHLNSVPMPEMKGLEKTDAKITIVTAVLDDGKRVGVAGVKSTSGKTVGKKQTAAQATQPASAPDADIEAETVGLVLTVLSERGGKVPLSLLPTEAFKRVTEAPKRNAVIGLIARKDWVSDAARPWKNDGGELSLPS